jgi:type IV pilus assembly protein PilV
VFDALKPLRPRRARAVRSCGGRNRGFTLIEVLVAMLVVSTGILGVVGMNIVSIKLQANSASRSKAATHAQDILERMRANLPQAQALKYNTALGAVAPTTLTNMAERDLNEWITNLSNTLPQGTASVQVDASGAAVITIQWMERENQSAAGRAVSYTFTTRL